MYIDASSGNGANAFGRPVQPPSVTSTKYEPYVFAKFVAIKFACSDDDPTVIDGHNFDHYNWAIFTARTAKYIFFSISIRVPNAKYYFLLCSPEPVAVVPNSPTAGNNYAVAQPAIQSPQTNTPPTFNASLPSAPSVSSVPPAPVVSSSPTITTASPISGSNYVYSEQQATIVQSPPNSASTKPTQQQQANQVRKN